MSRDATRIEGKAVLVTGANRGIGQTPVAGLYEDLTERAALERSLMVNLFGPHDLTHAFPPALTESRGTVFNVASLATWAAVPALPAYSVSKAAMFSLSQAQRVLWAERRVSLHAAILGPVETDMTRGLEIPKFSRSPSPTASSTALRPRRRRSSRIR